MKQFLTILFTITLFGCVKTLDRVNPLDGKSLALLTTTTATSITSTSVVTGGNVYNTGGLAITAKGVAYGLNQNPTTSDAKTNDGTGGAVFSTTISGLLPNTTYYARAYAVNLVGTAYGSQITFKTNPAVPPTITTKAVTNITTTSASIGGDISSSGDAPITARGTVWSTVTGPTVSLSSKTTDGSGIGSFISSLTGLTAGTRYYAKAYATNATGTYYGTEVKFAYVLAPTMAALPAPTVTTNGANVTATITADGGGDITSYGFVWGTSVNPTTSASSVTIANNTNGIYTNIPLSYSITGITRNVTYYVRSFAINSAGISYGQQTSFVLPGTSAIVTTSDATGLTATSVTIGGNVTDEGGSPVTAKGIVYSTLSLPTTALATKSSNGTGLGAFTTSISGLTRSTTYYYRAYATNANGTVYGTEKTFVTPAN
jgi:hypothetical protein